MKSRDFRVSILKINLFFIEIFYCLVQIFVNSFSFICFDKIRRGLSYFRARSLQDILRSIKKSFWVRSIDRSALVLPPKLLCVLSSVFIEGIQVPNVTWSNIENKSKSSYRLIGQISNKRKSRVHRLIKESCNILTCNILQKYYKK